MAGARQNVRLWPDEGLDADELDLTLRLKALPEPELPAGLEQRVREFLQGRRGYVGH
jgi:hypothetical protein